MHSSNAAVPPAVLSSAAAAAAAAVEAQQMTQQLASQCSNIPPDGGRAHMPPEVDGTGIPGRPVPTPHPAPPPDAIVPGQAQTMTRDGPMLVWTQDRAVAHLETCTKVSRHAAHKFLATWRDECRYTVRHIEDLTERLDRFDWVAYLAVREYGNVAFGRGGIVKFEIRYLRPHDSNTNYYRCDFVAYRPDMTAIRLHPSSSTEAIPVVVHSIRALAMDCQVHVDPLPQPSRRIRSYEGFEGLVFLGMNEHDKVQGKAFKAWLVDQQHRADQQLVDITHPALGDATWCPWPILLASTQRFAFLLDAKVKAVATCILELDGSIGLMFRRRDNGKVVTVGTHGTPEGNLTVW